MVGKEGMQDYTVRKLKCSGPTRGPICLKQMMALCDFSPTVVDKEGMQGFTLFRKLKCSGPTKGPICLKQMFSGVEGSRYK